MLKGFGSFCKLLVIPQLRPGCNNAGSYVRGDANLSGAGSSCCDFFDASWPGYSKTLMCFGGLVQIFSSQGEMASQMQRIA